MAMQPVVCPDSRQRIASRDRPAHATTHTAPATQDRNESIATAMIRARIKGAAIIFKIVRVVHTSYKSLIFASICIL